MKLGHGDMPPMMCLQGHSKYVKAGDQECQGCDDSICMRCRVHVLTLFLGPAPALDLTPDKLLVDAIRRPPVGGAARCVAMALQPRRRAEAGPEWLFQDHVVWLCNHMACRLAVALSVASSIWL